jgi:hypothetical protein
MRRPGAIFLSFSILLLAACAPADPRAKILEERSRWNIELLGWAAEDGGDVTVSTRISGPVHGSLEQFTFRVVMLDAANEAVERLWWTVDLTSIERGGPKDVLFRLPAPAEPIEALSIERVLDPGPQEMRFIKELEELAKTGVSPSGNAPAGS